MATSKHAEQVGRAIGVLRSVAPNMSGQPATRIRAAIGVLEDHADRLSQSVDVASYDEADADDLRSTVVLVDGVSERVEADESMVLDMAAQDLERMIDARGGDDAG